MLLSDSGTRQENPFWDIAQHLFTLAPSNQENVRNEAYLKFRKLLVSARKQAGLTQNELAVRLRRPQSFISKYERGERRLDIVEFRDVADALGIDPIRFLRKFYSGEA